MTTNPTPRPTPRRDLYLEVTEKIIAALEATGDSARWQRPWAVFAEHGLPQNGITGRHYGGINVLLLAMEAEQRGLDDSRYMTFKQASEAGFKIRKGAKSIPVYFFKKLEVEERDQETGELKNKAIPYLTEYRVFNAQDIEGLEPANNRPAQWQSIDVMEKIVKRLGVNVQYGGNKAFYDTTNDYVRLPVRGAYPNAEAFYGTLNHEIAHWTGNPSRLNRQFGPFGSEGYSREELRAEIASAMLSAETGISTSIENHAAYVASWIKVLKEDRREIFRAASDATKIVNFMLGRTEENAPANKETVDQDSTTLEPACAQGEMESRKRRPLRAAMKKYSHGTQSRPPTGSQPISASP